MAQSAQNRLFFLDWCSYTWMDFGESDTRRMTDSDRERKGAVAPLPLNPGELCLPWEPSGRPGKQIKHDGRRAAWQQVPRDQPSARTRPDKRRRLAAGLPTAADSYFCSCTVLWTRPWKMSSSAQMSTRPFGLLAAPGVTQDSRLASRLNSAQAVKSLGRSRCIAVKTAPTEATAISRRESIETKIRLWISRKNNNKTRQMTSLFGQFEFAPTQMEQQHFTVFQ